MNIRKKGRPSQDKVMRPYTLDRKLTEFLDSLPDGDRSKYVNRLLVQGVEIEKLSGKFYAYVLMRPDGSVFYVGKGQRDRINDHEKEARNGIESYKCRVIRKIWEEGGQILKQKVAFFDEEEDAYALEISLISFFGRENLTNSTDGGEGGGPIPVFKGKGRLFHFNLPAEVRPGEKMSIAQAFKKVAQRRGTVTALALETVLTIPEVQRLLREGK